MGQKSHADTSWLIALFNPEDSHHKQALRELEELTSAPAMSSLVLAELLVDFESSDSGSVSGTLNQIQKSFSSITSVTIEIAVRAAEIRSEQKVSLADAIVIATALEEQSHLLTFDKNMRAVYERIK
ncbi:MAG: type II toxin-antitoxin system VapC family toxin [Actinomycetota bacterium]